MYSMRGPQDSGQIFLKTAISPDATSDLGVDGVISKGLKARADADPVYVPDGIPNCVIV